MSSETLEEKTSTPLQSEGRARCRLSQLKARAGRASVGPRGIWWFCPMMGEDEHWRALDTATDPTLERISESEFEDALAARRGSP